MNIVSSGGHFQVYGDDVQTHDVLPAAFYNLEFHKMMGFFLTKRNEIIVNEDKIYGDTDIKTDKVMKSYSISERNFGVLLSGQKGVGKSLFVRVLARKAISANIPVIVVTTAIPGIQNFIASIDQDCVVIFDEFEKTFAKKEDWNPQDDLLSLFDGIDGGHKLFIVTCNSIEKLNSYMLNRPGRFHYHFALRAPSQEEVRSYLMDKVGSEHIDAINDVVALAGTIEMPYDYLRAIAFELNQGYSIKETMSDLNITRTDSMRFDLTIYFKNGEIYNAWSERIDVASHEFEWVRFRTLDKHRSIDVEFIPSLAHIVNGEYIIDEKIDVQTFDESDFDYLPEDQRAAAANAANQNVPLRIVLEKIPDHGPARFLV